MIIRGKSALTDVKSLSRKSVEEHPGAFSGQAVTLGRGLPGTRTLAFAQLRGCFSLAPGLWRFVMSATTRFSQNTCLLYFTAKLFQRNLKREIGVDDTMGHIVYQRDRPASRWLWRGW